MEGYEFMFIIILWRYEAPQYKETSLQSPLNMLIHKNQTKKNVRQVQNEIALRSSLVYIVARYFRHLKLSEVEAINLF